jgi:hypothetical protein
MMFTEHPLGYVHSDWTIQCEFVDFLGFQSYTPSLYFQSHLRYGQLTIVFWGMQGVKAMRATRKRSPYATDRRFFFIFFALDCYGSATKIMLVVSMTTFLNDARMTGLEFDRRKSCCQFDTRDRMDEQAQRDDGATYPVNFSKAEPV